jgi:hypothetical protein
MLGWLQNKSNKCTINLTVKNEAYAMTAKRFDEDERTQALNNNPCGMCRAMGFPRCQGHGGGGGGGDSGGGGSSDAEHDDATSKALDDVITSAAEASLALGDLFLESMLWVAQENEEDVYTYDATHALLSITLDLGLGSLVFSRDGDLSQEEQEELDLLFDAIEEALNEFKTELLDAGLDVEAVHCHREAGVLTMKMPTPTYYDAFIQRLMDKNLLVTQPKLAEKNDEVAVKQDMEVEQDDTYSSTAPNPFDISKGPKFRE